MMNLQTLGNNLHFIQEINRATPMLDITFANDPEDKSVSPSSHTLALKPSKNYLAIEIQPTLLYCTWILDLCQKINIR